jgi:hypothetical protein
LHVFRYGKRVADFDLELSKYNTALDAWKAEAAKKKKASLQLAASPPNPSGASESGAAGAAALVAMAGSTDPPAR